MKKRRRRIENFDDSARWAEDGDMMKRNYSSYAEYVAHRSAKLSKVAAQLGRNEPRDLADFRSVPILGHAARCQNSANAWARPGTEVEALIGLGYFAAGIDLDPGADNRYVLPGDFHNIICADLYLYKRRRIRHTGADIN